MSKKIKERVQKVLDSGDPKAVVDKPLSGEMESAFLEYSMSVIKSRALPDYRDGLKPVHRRIIYAAAQEGLISDRKHKKSAAIVGSVMGSYHPHGDAAIYEALVRMAQSFSLRYPLIDGQGNFGSIDGDSAAAMRYTEARLSELSSQFIEGLGEDWVEMVDNYDQSKKEPVVLPTLIPNILVNGSEGIAVGLATKIPPHNLGEVLDAAVALIKDPNLSIDRIKDYIKGPDFPTGGELLNYEGVLDYYGVNPERRRNRSFRLRGRVEIDRETSTKGKIIITEIPYGVKKSKIITQVVRYMNSDPKTGRYIAEFEEYIKAIRDESSMDGIRIVIEYSGCPAEVILNNLYKYTSLQVPFCTGLVVLINNEPKRLNIHEVLRLYIDYQFEVLRKKAKYRMDLLRGRIHILEGRLIVVDDIFEAIRIITTSDNPEEELQSKYSLSDEQLKDVLDLRVRSLKRLSIEEMQKEKNEKTEEADWNERLLGSQQMQEEELIKRLENIKQKFGDARKTIIRENKSGFISIEETRNYQNVLLICSEKFFLSQAPLSSRFFRLLIKGKRSKNKLAPVFHKNDSLRYMLPCYGKDDLLFFTDGGVVFKKKVYEFNLKNALEKAAGKKINNYITKLGKEGNVVQIMRLRENDYTNPNMFLIFVTSLGYAKKIHISKFKNINAAGKKAYKKSKDSLEKEGKLKFVLKSSQPNQEMMLVYGRNPNDKGADRTNKLIRISIDSFLKSITKKSENSKTPVVSHWKKTLKLEKGQQVYFASTTHEGERLVRVDTSGKISVHDWYNYARLTKGASKGVKAFSNKKNPNNRCVGFALAKPEDFILYTSSKGNIYKTSVEKWEIKKGRDIQGNYVLHEDLRNEGVSVTGFIALPKDDLENIAPEDSGEFDDDNEEQTITEA